MGFKFYDIYPIIIYSWEDMAAGLIIDDVFLVFDRHYVRRVVVNEIERESETIRDSTGKCVIYKPRTNWEVVGLKMPRCEKGLAITERRCRRNNRDRDWKLTGVR
jgi:hypothetical protein